LTHVLCTHGRANELMATCGGTRKKEGDVKKRKAKPKRGKGENGLAAVEEGEDGEEESAERDAKTAEEMANGEEEEDEEGEDDDDDEEEEEEEEEEEVEEGEESAGQDADEGAETGGVEEDEEDANAGKKKKKDKSNGAPSWRSAMPSMPSASSVMNWYSAPKVAKEEEEEDEEEEGKQRSAKSWREGCAIPGMDMSPGNATPLKGTKDKGKKGGKDKDARACGVDTSTFGGMGGLPKFQMPAMFGGKAAANGVAADTAKGKGSKPLKKRVVQQSEETRLIRAGVAGHGLVAREEEEDEEDGEEEERDDDEENEGQGSGRRAMRISSRALDGQQCGVGLVLESWKPRGLAQALNLVARTNEAVRVDAVVPDGPADHAVPRMEKGDILKEIDGVSVSSLAHAKELILGTPGSQVLARRGGERWRGGACEREECARAGNCVCVCVCARAHHMLLGALYFLHRCHVMRVLR